MSEQGDPPDPFERINRYFANYNAGRHLRLYEKFRHPELLLRAEDEFHKAKLPTPRWLAARIAEVGEAQDRATTFAELEQAIGVSSKPLVLRARERRRDIVEMYRILTQELNIRPNDATRRIAQHFRLRASNVARIVSQWGGLVIDAERSRSARRKVGRSDTTALRMVIHNWHGPN